MAIWSLFCFNSYCLHSSLVLQNEEGTANNIHSRERVMQGNLSVMVAYGIGALPLIKRLKAAYPDATQPWHADDSWALHTFDNLNKYFKSLKWNILAWGYYSEPTKIFPIVHPEKIKRGDCLAHIAGLRFAWVHIILEFIPGMNYTKAVGSKIWWRNGRETFFLSTKRRVNILRKVTPHWPVWSNLNDFFCNTWKNILNRRSRDWKRFWGNFFASCFLWRIENPPLYCRSSKYVSDEEIRAGPTKPCVISSREIYKLAGCNLQSDLFIQGRERVFNCWSHLGS